jgi:hypothetical protein
MNGETDVVLILFEFDPTFGLENPCPSLSRWIIPKDSRNVGTLLAVEQLVTSICPNKGSGRAEQASGIGIKNFVRTYT